MKPSRHWVYRVSFLLLIGLPMFLMGYKLYWLNYPLSVLIPDVSYQMDLSMQVDGHGDDIRLKTFLPNSDYRQEIRDEVNNGGEFSLTVKNQGLNRIAQWDQESVRGRHTVRYSYSVKASHVRYQIPMDAEIPTTYAPELSRYLKRAPGIQSDDPLIAKEIKKIFPKGATNLYQIVSVIHRHLQDNYKNKNFSGFTDAITALKLGEASCNGKGRLFVAMTRYLNVPSRLVGGFILETGSKRTSHQWVEVYIRGHWVPFDTINDHFAELPENYLTLYYGDEVLFSHTPNVNFKYFFKSLERLVPSQEAQTALQESALNMADIYAIFDRIGISQNLLKIILMIPFGALVTVFFRNVVGLETFGTFLPALIAAAARETGLWWGLLGFLVIIISAALVRRFLDWLQLLHSPKMAIMLTVVVVLMLLLTITGVNVGLIDLAHITLFPIAILAITAERFSILEEEQGLRKVSKTTLMTLFVIAACYLVMDSLFLQSMVLAFPEILLILIALNLWLGKWVGVRITEFIRFRRIIFQEGKA